MIFLIFYDTWKLTAAVAELGVPEIVCNNVILCPAVTTTVSMRSLPVVAPPVIVTASAVFTEFTRRVNVRLFPSPGDEVKNTLRLLKVIVDTANILAADSVVVIEPYLK